MPSEFQKWVDSIPRKPRIDNGLFWYGYIIDRNIDFDFIKTISFPSKPKVIDLGCGYCETLLKLKDVIPNAEIYGVEMNDKYVEDMKFAIKEFNLPITLFHQNFLDHDISEYDVIYTFCPAQKTDEYIKYVNFILDNMKLGAIWIEALARDSAPKDPSNRDGVIKLAQKHHNDFEVLYLGNRMIIIKNVIK